MTRLPSLDSLRVEGATVLLRSDLNVPLDDGEVADDFRIGSSLATIDVLLDRGAKVVVCSHLGRPKGMDPSLRMDPDPSLPSKSRTAWPFGWPCSIASVGQ